MRSMLLGVAETGLELTPKAAEGLFSMKFLLFIEIFAHIKVFAHR